MSMRLLPKSAVDKAKALDRQREVEEGAKLAKKVDALRELHSEEERGLTDFRSRTIKEIMGEINTLTTEKEALINDISAIKAERKLLLEPLDVKWQEVNKAQVICNNWEQDLERREEKVGELDKKLLNLLKVLDVEKGQIADERIRSKELVASSGRMYEEAKETLADARNKSQVILTEAEIKLSESNIRDEQVTAKERDILMLREHTKSWEKDLTNRERALKDKYDTLLRTEKRLNGKRSTR